MGRGRVSSKAAPSARRNQESPSNAENGFVQMKITADFGSYVLCVCPPLAPSRRYVHFSWGNPAGQADPMSFKLRDFIAGKLQYHPGGTRQAEKGFDISECAMDRDQVWLAAKEHIRPSRGNGLRHNVKRFSWWEKKLSDMAGGRV